MNNTQTAFLKDLLANGKIDKKDIDIVEKAIGFGYEMLSVEQQTQVQKYIGQGHLESRPSQTKASVEDNLALFDLLGGKMQCSACEDEDNYVKERIEKQNNNKTD
ncbi:hypothetical protein ACBP46_00955 [Paenalcaligenes hominis]|uniref:hypothetical protein n=1 Tax=Paenalcaligenes hominis TaxID=643674 RepID=UPI0035269F00